MAVFPNAVVILAASMHPNVPEVTRTARASGGSVILILENDEGAQEHLKDGVRGILYRDVPNAELLRCVRTVGRGEVHIQKRACEPAEGFESDLVAERVRERLTPKELKIVRLLLLGYKNRDIAVELHNSEQVIKNYLRSIFDKTGVSGRLELALFAMHHKLLGDDISPAAESREATQRMAAIN